MKRGQVVQIGPHRIMCGDAGKPEDVAMLFKGSIPDLVFTSPPYLNQRDYAQKISCWDSMMSSVFLAAPNHETTQILVNLGIIHKDNEWQPYWQSWVKFMQGQGWRRFGLYFWDKQEAYPADHNGRLAPCAELIFHFNRKTVYVNKIVPCKRPGATWRRDNVLRASDSMLACRNGVRVTHSHKIHDGVFRMYPEKGNARKLGHPAVFPVALPLAIQKSFTNTGGIVYDPFLGSGTSVIAANQCERIGYGMEISEEYCDIAVKRIRKAMAEPRQEKML